MSITASDARKDLFGLIEKVNQDMTVIEITSKRGAAVILAKSEYDSLVETCYLLGNPAMARTLYEAIEAVKRGELESHELIAE